MILAAMVAPLGGARGLQADELTPGEAARLTGPLAQFRLHLESAVGALLGEPPDPAAALRAVDAALGLLAVPGVADPSDLAHDLAAEAMLVRSEALQTLAPFPEGFRGEFLARIAPGAMLGDWSWGVPASVTMAQAILESGWGRVAPGNNLFGIKGEGPAGSERHRVVEWRWGKRTVRKDDFRLYRSVDESLEDHARLLGTAERYAGARSVADDPAAYARALQGRYASDPRYAAKLGTIAELYGLAAYDWAGPAPFREPGRVALHTGGRESPACGPPALASLTLASVDLAEAIYPPSPSLISPLASPSPAPSLSPVLPRSAAASKVAEQDPVAM